MGDHELIPLITSLVDGDLNTPLHSNLLREKVQSDYDDVFSQGWIAGVSLQSDTFNSG